MSTEPIPIDATDEMVAAFRIAWNQKAADLAATSDRVSGEEATRAGLAAVLPMLREQIADVLEDRAGELRGYPLRSGEVDFRFINGIEAAARMVRREEGRRD